MIYEFVINYSDDNEEHIIIVRQPEEKLKKITSQMLFESLQHDNTCGNCEHNVKIRLIRRE